jgi:hypothetical protein
MLALSAAVITIAVAVSIAGIAGLCGLARYWWQATEPGRTYDMTLTALGAQSQPRKTVDARKDQHKLIELPVGIRAKKPVVTSTHSFPLVTRHLSPRLNRIYKWQYAPTELVSVCRIWDAELENQRSISKQAGNPFGGGPDRFSARANGNGGWIAEYELKEAAIQVSFHYRVIIEMHDMEIWRGFLQFTATGKAGRISHTYRSVTLWP